MTATPHVAVFVPPGRSTAGRRRVPAHRAPQRRLPSLDGVRALAVLGVLLYHAGVGWAHGGLLGVDVFFVLSGFLITTLLLEEYRRDGRINLRAFWGRRARRLLPALVLVLVALSAEALFVLPADQLSGLRGDMLSTLGYVANWHFAFSGQGYFDHFSAPSPLLHTWSLAVEEQFYVFWPLIAVLVLRRHTKSALARVAIIGAVASTTLMAILSLLGTDDSRLYYGTDTRAAPLLFGAALAALRPPGGLRLGLLAKWLLSAAGLAATALLLWLLLRVDGQDPVLYRGGFAVVALAVVVLLACLVEMPQGPLSRVFGLPPLAATGRISYGLYLWHWPLFLLLNHERTSLTGGPLLALRLSATVVVSIASFALLEEPIRTRRLRLPSARLLVPWVAVSLVALILLGTNGAKPDTAQAQAQATGGAPDQPAAPPQIQQGPARPTRVLLTGDSVAFTLGESLKQNLPSNLQFYNGGTLGCGIARLLPVRDDGVVGTTNADWCRNWERTRADMVSRFDPDVSVLLVGRWEVLDRQLNGRWSHLGEPPFDDYIRRELLTAIDVLSAGGRPVVLMTTPAFAAHEKPDGGVWDQDDPTRVARFNQLIRDAAAQRPGIATVFDLNALVTPGNQYTAAVNGVSLRLPDGIHMAPASGAFVAPQLAPLLSRLGDDHRRAEGSNGSTAAPR